MKILRALRIKSTLFISKDIPQKFVVRQQIRPEDPGPVPIPSGEIRVYWLREMNQLKRRWMQVLSIRVLGGSAIRTPGISNRFAQNNRRFVKKRASQWSLPKNQRRS
jgi:hypothetical protein